MKYLILLICFFGFCTIQSFSQVVYYQHYFNSTTHFESDTFNVQFASELSYPQFSNIDSVIIVHNKIVNHSSISYSQSVLNQLIVPYNCTYSIAKEETDIYGNTLQTIVLKNIQQAQFGINYRYEIANKTTFQGFIDCPFQKSFIQSLPISITQYLQSTNLIQSQNPEIVALAKQITEKCVTIADFVEAIVLWNKQNISYDYTFNHDLQDAVSVMHNKTALCEGYSNLSCALLRSLGIPARYISGYSVNNQNIQYSYSKGSGWFNQEKGAHAWIEVYYPSIGEWVPTEPQNLANFITPVYVTNSNTISKSDEFIIRSTVPNLQGTKTWVYKGTNSDTLYYTNTAITRSEPIKPYVDFDVLLALEIGRAHGCNVSSLLPDIVQYIVGNYVVCEASQQVYKVPKVPGATSYEWTLPNGTIQITTDTLISLVINPLPIDGILRVRGKNENGYGIEAQLPMWVSLLPEKYQLTGPDEVCKGHTNAQFTIQNTGAVPHWTILPGTSGTFTTTTLSLYITNSAQSGTIEVYGSNLCGNGPKTSLQVAVLSKTPKPKILYDSLYVCYNDADPEVLLSNTYGSVYWIYNDETVNKATLVIEKSNDYTPGVYKVYQQQTGCAMSDTSSGIVYWGKPLVQPIISYQTDSILQVQSSYSFTWYANTTPYSMQTVTIKPLISAEFYVLSNDEYGCSIQSNTISFTPPQTHTSTSNVSNEIVKPYHFYSNGNLVTICPINDNLSIYECVLYSVTGELIESKKSSTCMSFSLNSLPKTMYFIEIKTLSQVYIERIIK